MSKRLLSSLVAMSLIWGTYGDRRVPKQEQKLYERPKGKEPVGKTKEQRLAHNLHEKKIKARRNAKKGIYEHKISYKHLKKVGER